MKRIVVTGATSMIGVALIEEAIKNNVEVLAIVRENSSRISRIPQSPLINIKSCDIERLNEFTVEENTYDVFYHFAWNYTNREGRLNAILQARNINTTLEAVELAHKMGCKKFIGAGSQAEYGIVEGVISHDTPTNPVVPYGVAKFTAGKMSKMLCEQYGMQYVWGRIFSVYGRYDNEGTMINYAIDQFLKGESANFSAAMQMWNYLNEHDAGRIFYKLGQCNNAIGVYCVANKESMRLRTYIEKLAEKFGNEAKCVFAEADNNVKVVGLEADVSKLSKDIGFEPAVSFEKGIEEVIQFRKSMKV